MREETDEAPAHGPLLSPPLGDRVIHCGDTPGLSRRDSWAGAQMSRLITGRVGAVRATSVNPAAVNMATVPV